MELLNTFFVGFVAGVATLFVLQQLVGWFKRYVASLLDFEDYAESIYIGERPAQAQTFHFGVPEEQPQSQLSKTPLQPGRVTH